MKTKKNILISLIVFGSFSFSLLGITIDQDRVEKILRANRYFLETINVCISNFGTEKNKKDLVTANEKNFKGHKWYLRSDFVHAYKEFRKSQEFLKGIYLDILEKRYLDDAEKLLDSNAPYIIQKKDKKAEKYLQLGYRDLENAKQFLKIGRNFNRFLYANKIRYYIEGIKRARRAKRFAYLALIESNTPLEDKEQYKTQTLDEHLRKNDEEYQTKISAYRKIHNKIINMLNRGLIKGNKNFKQHHDDNYGFINPDKKDILVLSVPQIIDNLAKEKLEKNKNQSNTEKKAKGKKND